MNDRKKQVMSFVRKRLMYWQTEPNPHLVRADLANLRRGIGKKPGRRPSALGASVSGFSRGAYEPKRQPYMGRVGGVRCIDSICHASAGQRPEKCIWMGKGWELPSAAWQTAMKIT